MPKGEPGCQWRKDLSFLKLLTNPCVLLNNEARGFVILRAN